MIEIEADEDLHQAMMEVKPREAVNVAAGQVKRLWNQRWGRCSQEVVSTPIPFVLVVDEKVKQDAV